MVDIYVKRWYKINYLSSTGIRCKAVYCHEIYIVETKRFLTMADLFDKPFHGFVSFSHHGTSQGKSVDTIGKSALRLVKVPNLKVINDLTL